MSFDEATRAHIIELFERTIPLHRHLGLKILELRQGVVKARIPFRSEFVGDFRIDRWHGGMMALLVDVIGGMAAMTTLKSPDDPIVTVDLRVDYLRPATNHDIIAEADVIRSGASIVVTEMRCFDADEDALLTRGTGVFNRKKA